MGLYNKNKCLRGFYYLIRRIVKSNFRYVNYNYQYITLQSIRGFVHYSLSNDITLDSCFQASSLSGLRMLFAVITRSWDNAAITFHQGRWTQKKLTLNSIRINVTRTEYRPIALLTYCSIHCYLELTRTSFSVTSHVSSLFQMSDSLFSVFTAMLRSPATSGS